MKGKVNSEKCPILVDTAFNQTFVRPDLQRRQYLPKSAEQLCVITKHCTSGKGIGNIRLRITDQVDNQPTHVDNRDEGSVHPGSELLNSE